ncbi:M15 family metallopeptidase [Winogradskyella sp. R77965]|uniref:M15 family metallopeptidase n=1 Tax=Winogradskyella sp. R77965 TaxID=3093872 RepID=UPI0037DC5396
MKSFLAVFSIILFVLSCNLKNKKINTSENNLIQIDTIKPEENLNKAITKVFVLGKFEYRVDTTFTKVNSEHSAKTLYLKKEVYSAFLDMLNAAKQDGIVLKILSGTRNYKEQKAIWERKWNMYNNLKPLERAQKILEYSSMPSSSRHHWGTDLDLNSLSNSYFSSGNGKTVYDWLNANANDFGFYQVYTQKDSGRTGYNLEKWHWSYLPLASKYLEFYNDNITYKDINGFIGSELAIDLNIIEDYVNGISNKAKE